jgi:hypothetical protein
LCTRPTRAFQGFVCVTMPLDCNTVAHATFMSVFTSKTSSGHVVLWFTTNGIGTRLRPWFFKLFDLFCSNLEYFSELSCFDIIINNQTQKLHIAAKFIIKGLCHGTTQSKLQHVPVDLGCQKGIHLALLVGCQIGIQKIPSVSAT